MENVAYLVTVTPEVVLGADVLVGVLGPLGARVLVLLMGNVLPVGIPSNLCVDAGNDDAGDGDAAHSVSMQFVIQCGGAISEFSIAVPRALLLPKLSPFPRQAKSVGTY